MDVVIGLLALIGGTALLTVGADVLVGGAASLATRFGVPRLVVGLTLIAAGTSAPEMAVSSFAALEGHADLAFGNVVGSNTFNILVVLGTSALIYPVLVDPALLRVDIPILVALTLGMIACSIDGDVSRIEGAAMLVSMAGYMAFMIWRARSGRAEGPELDGIPDEINPLWKDIGGVVIGIGGLVIGSRIFVTGAVDLGRMLGVSELMLGITVVSVGTSLPELATSVAAARRGESDMAAGNVVGSNIFNILSVLGLSAALSPIGIPVAADALSLDLPVMIGATILMIPIFAGGLRVGRLAGLSLLVIYAVYLTVMCLLAAGYDVTQLRDGFVFFGLPAIIALAMVFAVLRARRAAAA